MACKKSFILKDNVELQQLLYVLPADYNMLINWCLLALQRILYLFINGSIVFSFNDALVDSNSNINFDYSFYKYKSQPGPIVMVMQKDSPESF